MGTKSQVVLLPPFKTRKLWKLRHARGIATMVPSSQIANHLQWLVDIGFTDGSIGAAAGLPQRTVSLVRRGAYEQTRVEQATRLMSVSHIPVAAQSTTMVPALGARRRIHALQAIGHSYEALSEASGVYPQSFKRFATVNQITGRNWQLVADLYDQLSGTPGPSRLTESRSRKRGFHPPLAWEGLDIDRPDHEPTADSGIDTELVDHVLLQRVVRGEHRGKIPKAERDALLDHAIEHGWTSTKVAAHLNISADAGDQALVRHRKKLREAAA